MYVSVCLFVSTLTAEPFDVGAQNLSCMTSRHDITKVCHEVTISRHDVTTSRDVTPCITKSHDITSCTKQVLGLSSKNSDKEGMTQEDTPDVIPCHTVTLHLTSPHVVQ